MKDFLSKLRGAVVAGAAALAAMLPSDGGLAQSVQQLPIYLNINTTTDLGNGPNDYLVVLGNAWMFTSSGSGLSNSSSASTTLNLTAVPANPPCVGCLLTQTGNNVTPGGVTSVTITAYNGVTSLTISSALTLGANTPLAWGSSCPAFSAGLPSPALAIQAGTQSYPMYTLARLCGYAANGPGATLLPFPIGAH